MRAERKQAAKAVVVKSKTPEEMQAEIKAERKRRRRQEEQQAWKELVKQEREHKKQLRRQKQQTKKGQKQSKQSSSSSSSSSNNNEVDDEQEVALRLIQEIKHGRTDPTSGMTTLSPSGVQYKDLVLGKPGSAVAQSSSLVTVKYRLTGRKSGTAAAGAATLIDSNNKFTFSLGKNQVIAGFDLGVQGMRPGGRRHVVVPPKAGYGSQDIGAGPGAMLYFDITLLQVSGGGNAL